MGLRVVGGMVKSAKEYADQLAQLNILGMTHRQVAESIAAAWKTTGTVLTTTATQNIAAIRELRQVFGGNEEGFRNVIGNLDTVQKMQAVLSAATGGKIGGDQAYTVAKALEMKGATREPAEFTTESDMMTKAIVASGAKVTPQDFLQAFKYGRAATAEWSNAFAYTVLPTLIQEMKSSGGMTNAIGGPGNALMSLYAGLVGGVIPQKNLETWKKMGLSDAEMGELRKTFAENKLDASNLSAWGALGLLDPSKVVKTRTGATKGVQEGAILGWELFQQNPYLWAQQILGPAMERAGYRTDQQKSAVIAHLVGSRTAQFMLQQMTVQGWKFARDIPLYQSAEGLSAYQKSFADEPDARLPGPRRAVDQPQGCLRHFGHPYSHTGHRSSHQRSQRLRPMVDRSSAPH